MSAELEPGLLLVENQLDCIKATFQDAEGFTLGEDERGEAFHFDNFRSPVVSAEVIRTHAGSIRGNHVHQHCEETLHIIMGEIELYLLCEHGEHVFRKVLQLGNTVITHKGTPHTLYATQESECMVFFDNNPLDDTARVPILKFPKNE